MAAELAASERLNYLSKKQRAVSSRHSRQIISANNGNSFTAGGVTTIQIAGGQAASYLDFQNSYLRFTITCNDATHGINLASGYDTIERLEILADGQTISNIGNYNVVVDQYMSSEVGADWKGNFGRLLAKVSEDPWGTAGVALAAAGGSSTVCLPLVLTPLFSVNKYIPLVGRSNLQIRITWAQAKRAYSGNAGLVDTEVVYSPVDFVASTVRLSADANAMVMANTGGRFELVCSDIRCAQGTHSVTADSSIALNCGFSFSSLDRVSFSFYPDIDKQAAYSIRNRSRGGLNNFALAVNGEEYPRKRIEVGDTNVSEAIAEIGIAHRSLADFNHQSTFLAANYAFSGQNPSGSLHQDGSAEAQSGDFLAMIDTESMQPHTGDSLYSGISTLGSVVQLVGDCSTFTGPGDGSGEVPAENINQTLFVFAQFTTALTLDMQGTQTWVVSI